MEQFTMRLSWLPAIQNLGDAERGRLLTGLLEYARKQEPKGLRGNERFVFETIAKEIDAERAGLVRPVQNAQTSVQNALYISESENIKAQPSEEGTKNTRRYLLNAMFEEFWKAYPTHVNKKRCLPLWEKINPDEDLLRKMLDSIEAWKKTRQWKDGYIPNPDTWLRNEKWEDEAPPDYTKIRMNNKMREKDPFFNYDEARGNNSGHIKLIELTLDDL